MKKYIRDGFPGMNYERRLKREERQSSRPERGVTVGETASRRERRLDFRARGRVS